MKKAFLSALKKAASVVPVVILFVTAMQASAAMVTSIHTGHGAGTLDGVAFDADFAITALADTSTVTSTEGGGLSNNNISATIYISSVGVFSFITPTMYISDENGISFAAADGTRLFETPTTAAWDMTSSLPPAIAFNASLLQWALGNVVTTGGVLAFDTALTPSAFTATVSQVPVPAGVWLFGSGLVGLVGIARRKA